MTGVSAYTSYYYYSGQYNTQHTGTTTTYATGYGMQLADISGRGGRDLVISYQGAATNYLITNCGKDCVPYWSTPTPGPVQVWVSTWTGSGYATPVQVYSSSTASVTGIQSIDVNGDGLSDLYVRTSAGDYVYISNGNALAAPISLGTVFTACTSGMSFGDMFGTGRTDMICGNTTSVYVEPSNGS